ncbi:MAG: aspartate ammonia-lyase [Anaerolineaceae bacterium]|jgi:aspartate ammonia-lyase|nr:aspartate ammonia-lyase [Anaerolineae bacterium]MBL1172141.1 aspartate ammonia-lyase [Chloroflexota bacterium]MBV6466732.1 Aspartate ammonia-lyase [Anaerolineales bacterium]MCE7904471.1 aspartate ammonia-lyase [Anaerolineae bacterium CFX3]MDL1927130.1 aspartate ammonia-lyase [Anaerolineae bacterium AMX1]GER80486.1 aspartate ammonia-lyase [Candidatus Denitrolinea symbiosum]GJQ39869.1 MAG: aspartate ammonia-lyase [Anaerolineaceae bacterium]
MNNTRLEHDLLGDRDVPADRYFGIQTLRAVENFSISGITIARYPGLIKSLAYIKKAAALTNHELGLLDREITDAICRACDDLLSGALLDEFVVDVIQGGAGTSTNMNANEVIANRALELLGYEKGRYDVLHPLNHVNMSQSTNDVYPTALRLTLSRDLDNLVTDMAYLRDAFARKSKEFADVIKMGRTQLQDAVPMTLGQEFGAWAIMVTEDIERVTEAQSLIREINMGATAIGTGLNSHPNYAALVTEKLRDLTGIPVVGSQDLVEATQDTGAYIQLSSVLKRVATKISKICNDLRLLSSGPRAGLHEINLPAMAPGSTIMPGKVNPIIPEVVNQVAFEVIGNDITVTLAAEAGQLELNVMEPVIAFNLFTSLNMLGRACRTLADRCVNGITANREVCRAMVKNSIGLVTALNPYIGYEKATLVANEALKSGRSVYEIVLEKGYLSQAELDDILAPENMTRPRYIHRR